MLHLANSCALCVETTALKQWLMDKPLAYFKEISILKRVPRLTAVQPEQRQATNPNKFKKLTNAQRNSPKKSENTAIIHISILIHDSTELPMVPNIFIGL